MKLWFILLLIPIALVVATVSLMVQATIEEQAAIHAEFRYYETLDDFNERTIDRAIYIISKQEQVIHYQRKIIAKLGQSPCVEKMWIMTGRKIE